MSADDVIDGEFKETTALAIPDTQPPAETTEKRFLSLTEVRSLGDTFFQSGMFKDVRSAAQCVVKIIAGQELGIGPMSAMTQIQIVEGKPTLTAPAIGGRVKASGRYDYRIIEHSEQVCHLRFFERGVEIGESRFTMDDAKVADLARKDVWKKYPRNMLFARAMTNGARWYCADVFNGAIYTPEELGGLPPVDPPKTVTPDAPPPKTNAEKMAELRDRWSATFGWDPAKTDAALVEADFRAAFAGKTVSEIRAAVEAAEDVAAGAIRRPASPIPDTATPSGTEAVREREPAAASGGGETADEVHRARLIKKLMALHAEVGDKTAHTRHARYARVVQKISSKDMDADEIVAVIHDIEFTLAHNEGKLL